MGAGISKKGPSRGQRQAWEARAAEAERALREAQERLLRLESQAQEGQKRHAEAGDLQRGTSGSPEQARVADAERTKKREVTEERLVPHHSRRHPEVDATARVETVGMGQRAAQGTTEDVGPY
jgi:hypothetical protein